MNPFYILKPEVPGGLGERSIVDTSVHPGKVTHLQFEFEGWLGDQLVTSFPCYLVTDSLAETLAKNQVSGYELAYVEVTRDIQFQQFEPDQVLPAFHWLKVVGKQGESDLFITPDHRLGVTRKALDLVMATHPRILKVEAVD